MLDSESGGGKTESDFETVIAPIKAFFVKNDCSNLLNKLIVVQAFHNNVNMKNLEGISKDPKTQQPTVVN